MTRSMKITIRGNNVVFESRHSDDSVIRRMGELIADKTIRSEFAINVWSKRNQGLTFKQLLWLHFLVAEVESNIVSETKDENLFNVVRIVALLETARRNGIKWPVLHAETETERHIRMSLTGSESQEPGSVSITNGDRETYFGRIHRNGHVVKDKLPADIEKCLLLIVEDPIKFARLYGRRVGKCCFGNHHLTNKNSIALGYGPICAEKWGLYHSYAKGAVEGSEDHMKPSEILVAAGGDKELAKAIKDGTAKAKRSSKSAQKQQRYHAKKHAALDSALGDCDDSPVVPPYMIKGTRPLAELLCKEHGWSLPCPSCKYGKEVSK